MEGVGGSKTRVSPRRAWRQLALFRGFHTLSAFVVSPSTAWSAGGKKRCRSVPCCQVWREGRSLVRERERERERVNIGCA